ncbi:hypothetical protein MUP77_17105 [Candidatus Bathyarchaeota archaeon]|nr:hypothetical protein [Candidatus Bathyarchaeota archaeon]
MSELIRPTGIRKELYKELQHYCIDHDLKQKEVLEIAIEQYLKRNNGSRNS